MLAPGTPRRSSLEDQRSADLIVRQRRQMLTFMLGRSAEDLSHLRWAAHQKYLYSAPMVPT